MRGYLGVTDIEWFTFLRGLRPPPDEVNFWQPNAHGFGAPPGTPFFFKLKAPHDAIGGFGIFARYEPATPTLAWDAFGQKNGAASYEAMATRIGRYSRDTGGPAHRIGCIMVSQPIFFADSDWIEQPTDWSRNIVSGAGYDLAAGEGLRIWRECQERAARLAAVPLGAPEAWADSERYGPAQLVRPRLGQGTFRLAVTGAYGSACAVSREHSLPVLEAAHIRPYANAGPHGVSNGLLLRADIHRLFDAGYVTVTPEHRFVVSRMLKEAWGNGRIYSQMEGPIELPRDRDDYPSAEYLRWHNESVFEKPAA